MFNKLIRIGKDTELRVTQGGKSVATISGVYDVGWGDKKKSQWIEAALWGKQAEALTQYLVKGKQVVIYADDLCVETYDKKDGGQGNILRCRIVSIDLTSGGEQKQAQPRQQQPAQHEGRGPGPQQNLQPALSNTLNKTSTGFDNDFSDDIPF